MAEVKPSEALQGRENPDDGICFLLLLDGDGGTAGTAQAHNGRR
ncbi:MAG TPA: hypothetical protein VMB80_11760 [Candidatus Acidoferrum sp.]|nr:hypothetical protein [Candidatus Acidoferrum sp.]